MNHTILEAIEEAKHMAEAKLIKAELTEACCEQETYETEAMVAESELTYMVSDRPEAGYALDKAYDLHDKAMREYYEAREEVKNLRKVVELLEQAGWYA